MIHLYTKFQMCSPNGLVVTITKLKANLIILHTHTHPSWVEGITSTKFSPFLRHVTKPQFRIIYYVVYPPNRFKHLPHGYYKLRKSDSTRI